MWRWLLWNSNSSSLFSIILTHSVPRCLQFYFDWWFDKTKSSLFSWNHANISWWSKKGKLRFTLSQWIWKICVPFAGCRVRNFMSDRVEYACHSFDYSTELEKRGSGCIQYNLQHFYFVLVRKLKYPTSEHAGAVQVVYYVNELLILLTTWIKETVLDG